MYRTCFKAVILASLALAGGCSASTNNGEDALSEDALANPTPWFGGAKIELTPTLAIAHLTKIADGHPERVRWEGEIDKYAFLPYAHHLSMGLWMNGKWAGAMQGQALGAGYYSEVESSDVPWNKGRFKGSHFRKTLTWEQVVAGVTASYAGGSFMTNWTCHQIAERVARKWGMPHYAALALGMGAGDDLDDSTINWEQHARQTNPSIKRYGRFGLPSERVTTLGRLVEWSGAPCTRAVCKSIPAAPDDADFADSAP